MEHTPYIDALHMVTSASYAVVGIALWFCGISPRFRLTLLRDENDRAVTFKLVAVFVLACFIDHAADAVGDNIITLRTTAAFEALVSAGTAAFLTVKAWRQCR